MQRNSAEVMGKVLARVRVVICHVGVLSLCTPTSTFYLWSYFACCIFWNVYSRDVHDKDFCCLAGTRIYRILDMDIRTVRHIDIS